MRSHPDGDLSHVPGPPPDPVFGHNLRLLRDPIALHRAAAERYGPVYRIRIVGVWQACLAGADALEAVLLDRERTFSAHLGWEALHNLFPGGLLLRDFDDHRAHRRVMQDAFRAAAMRVTLAAMNTEIERELARWRDVGVVAVYPATKALTLRLGARVLMGLDDSHDLKALNRALVTEVRASFGLIRRPLPLTLMWRGVRARRFLTDTFRALIAERRAGGGDDFFSRLCRAEDDGGRSWTDEEIVDHFNFLLMAAHDTTTSALTAMVEALAFHSDWQDAMRAEIAGLAPGSLGYDDLDALPVTERVFREVLRIMPPVPFIPRKTVKPFTWAGVAIPQNAHVMVSPGMVGLSPDLWTAPERFDPDRFASGREEDRSHRFAWAPFGGGAHKCIGMHFSSMQVKAFMVAFLRRYRVRPAAARASRWQRLPIPRPTDGLPVRLTDARVV